MRKYLELTCVGNCQRILIPLFTILYVEEYEEFTFVANKRTKKGYNGFNVVETFNDIKSQIAEV